MSHRALIVEDDRDVATLIDRALRNAGLSTAVHGSGEGAVEIGLPQPEGIMALGAQDLAQRDEARRVGVDDDGTQHDQQRS